jgi:hypothetical protein
MSSFLPLPPPAHSFFIGPTVINIHIYISFLPPARLARSDRLAPLGPATFSGTTIRGSQWGPTSAWPHKGVMSRRQGMPIHVSSIVVEMHLLSARHLNYSSFHPPPPCCFVLLGRGQSRCCIRQASEERAVMTPSGAAAQIAAGAGARDANVRSLPNRK